MYLGPNFNRFELIKIDINTLSPFNNTAHTFIDSAIQCGEKYCYVLKTVIGTTTKSYSDTFCVTANSNTIPPAVDIFSTYLNESQLLVSWIKPQVAIKEFNLSKNGISFLSNTDTFSIFDQNSRGAVNQ